MIEAHAVHQHVVVHRSRMPHAECAISSEHDGFSPVREEKRQRPSAAARRDLMRRNADEGDHQLVSRFAPAVPSAYGGRRDGHKGRHGRHDFQRHSRRHWQWRSAPADAEVCQ